ncbi:unnamed protein product [Rhizophagus irregularis]|nr:unnamed protein product [Rhizophagus irregularis]
MSFQALQIFVTFLFIKIIDDGLEIRQIFLVSGSLYAQITAGLRLFGHDFSINLRFRRLALQTWIAILTTWFPDA